MREAQVLGHKTGFEGAGGMPPLKMWMGSEEFKDQDRAWGQGEEAFVGAQDTQG